MSVNRHYIYYNEDKSGAIVEFYHGRSDYVARVRVSFYNGVDGGVAFENMTRDGEVAVIPADILVKVFEGIGALPAVMAGRE